MPWDSEGAYWVGRHKSRGLVVVPHNALSPDSVEVDVYFVDQDRVAVCDRNIMREHTTGKGVLADEASGALLLFHGFKQRDLERKKRGLEEKNRLFLERYGKQFAGLCQRSTRRNIRLTHCWHCHSKLDSTIDLECIACHWILCQCGACGCGR